MAVINKVTLPSEDLYDVQTLSIPFGQVDSTSTATAFTATIPGITSLYDGVCVYLKNGVITSASGWTLNINDLGAKPVYQTQAAASRTTTIFNVAYTGLFVYNSSRVDDGCWDYFYGYNSDTNTTAYQIRGNQATLKMYAALTRYKVCFSRFDGSLLPSTATSNSTGTSKTLTTESFDPHGLIYYYTTTTGVAADETPGASYMWLHYPTVDLRYGFNTGTTLVAKEPVYIQCSPQNDGSFKLSGNSCIVQELPSTNDGYAYIYLGKAFDTYRMSLDLHHPIYCYKNGAIVQWGSGSDTTPDWDENDNTSSSYIQNRTHYIEDPVMTEIWTIPIIASNTYYEVEITDGDWIQSLEEGTPYSIVFNGSTYTGTFRYSENNDSYIAGNIDYGGENDDGVPFVLNIDTYKWAYLNIKEGSVSSDTIFSLSISISNIHTLDDKYLNGSLIKSGTGIQSEIFNGLQDEYSNNIEITISGEANATTYEYTSSYEDLTFLEYFLSSISLQNHSDIKVIEIVPGYITFSSTLNETEALTDYTLVLEFPNKIASGDYSHSEGDSTTASGDYSHAEGSYTIASGSASHTEGNSTTASGNASHAEGNATLASGLNSHAEGAGNLASGNASHAEGGYNSSARYIYLTGEAGATTYTVNSVYLRNTNVTAYVSNLIDFCVGNNRIVDQTKNNDVINTITFDRTLNKNNALSNARRVLSSRSIASGESSHAEGCFTRASSLNSHAEGFLTVASGSDSHAEGYGTNASASYSHAEGFVTVADGVTSHTEGYRTTASGDRSHAEGYYTIASGYSSHTEGESTTASGYYSHAEGSNTTASGDSSHAEGYYTIAQRRSQHVFGEYNTADTTGASKSYKGSYVEIVGNGTADNARSNARTLDWSGNEVLAGKLTVGTGPTNNMDVATKQYVDNAVSGGSGGILYITITGNQNDGFATTANFDDVYAAYQNGYDIKAINGTEVYNLSNIASSGMSFSKNTASILQQLTWAKSSGNITYSRWVAANLTVSSLADTSITSPTNGQVLMYNSTTSKWENTSLPIYNGGVSS